MPGRATNLATGNAAEAQLNGVRGPAHQRRRPGPGLRTGRRRRRRRRRDA